MSRIIKLAEKDRRTVIASIHQPSSEVFELFHNLCLLSYGRLVYFGPTSSTNKIIREPVEATSEHHDSLDSSSGDDSHEKVGDYACNNHHQALDQHHGDKQEQGEVEEVSEFVASLLTLMAIGGFPSFVEDLKNKFTHFFYLALLLFVTVILVESLMMVVASIVPDFLMGINTGAGVQGVMMLTGGFYRLPDDLPKPFWRYPMYYNSFHMYVNQGLYKNEFIGVVFPPFITGDWLLRNTWQMEMGYSKWIDVVILFVMVVVYRLIF
ncbi:hypothetical protein Droror1_Dr00021878 [Drosera rotundifolia]